MFLIKLKFIWLVSVLHVEVAPGAYKQQTGSGWSCDQAMSPFSLGFIVRVYLSNWTSYSPFRQFNKCERVEPRSHFKSRLSLIVRVKVVQNRTVVDMTVTDVSTTCAVVIFSVKVSCVTSVDGIVLWLLMWLVNYVAMLLVVCQLSRDGIGYEDS